MLCRHDAGVPAECTGPAGEPAGDAADQPADRPVARRAERRRDLDDEAERVFAKNIMYEKVVKDGGGPAWNDVKRYRQRR
ncbi:hypothetical protein KJ567_04580, partial [Candidatus Bipolaricaulota bacterium]|nr:hypothetical protein [Candidatus Bipolaricaulota bacterium]